MHIQTQYWLLGALLTASIFFHLGGLDYPRQVVFDEVHFGKFVNSYCCTGERFFDIHPPHAKLLIAGAVALTDYDGSFSFDHIGLPYAASVLVTALRVVPALFGILLPLIMYFLLRQVGVGLGVSLVGATAVLLDNALLVQTRILALDGILLVAQFGALLAYLVSRTREGWMRWGLIILAGALCGLSAGVKFTGLAILLLLGLMWLWELWMSRAATWRRLVLEGVILVLTAFVIYAAGWWLHYALLPLPGSGDVWQIPTGNVWADTVEMHQKMLSANYNLAASHVYSSSWWTWPVMMRPVFYWQGSTASIYFLGNPVVWWGAFSLLLTVLTRIVWWRMGKASGLPPGAWLFLTGYIVSLLPFMRIPRALFLYHYATPLLFSILLSAVYLQSIWPQELGRQQRWYGWILVCLLGGFILFSPLTFGFDSGQTWRILLFWFPTWR